MHVQNGRAADDAAARENGYLAIDEGLENELLREEAIPDVTSSKEYRDAQDTRPEASPPFAAMRGGSIDCVPTFEEEAQSGVPVLEMNDNGAVLITLTRAPTMPVPESKDVRRTPQTGPDGTSGNSSTVYDYGLSQQLNQAPVETLSEETKAQIVSKTGAHMGSDGGSAFGHPHFEGLEDASGQPFPLQQQLFDAFAQHPHNDKGEWLPINKLEELITPLSVRRELQSKSPDLSSKEIDNIIDYVCKRYRLDNQSSSSSSQPKYTSGRKIFAVLVLMERVQAIQKFIKEDLSDKDLPFTLHSSTGVTRLKRKGEGDRFIEACLGWTPHQVKSFDEYQWKMLSPFFSKADGKDKVFFYLLEDRIVLPFVEDTERECPGTPGGYGTVWRIKIHAGHHNFDCPEGVDPSFAVKRLNSHIEGDFNQEVETLKKFSNKHHMHLIKLLATFKWAGSYYLLFPWAEGNLRDLWESHPQPEITNDHITWVAEQCHGISTGLYSIHNYQHSSDLKNLAVSDSASGSHTRKRFGRHGDIKPENILWFTRYDEVGGRGVLKISDFGLTRFNSRLSRSGIPPKGLPVSLTYRPPECDLPDGSISQAFDLWPLGCLFLEFVTWLLMGFQATHETFSSNRVREDTSEWNEDVFFKIVKDESGIGQVAHVKDAVLLWVDELHAHENCTEYLHEFLDFTMESLLVPDPKERASCAELVGRLDQMWKRCQANERYCVLGVPRFRDEHRSDLHQELAAVPVASRSASPDEEPVHDLHNERQMAPSIPIPPVPPRTASPHPTRPSEESTSTPGSPRESPKVGARAVFSAELDAPVLRTTPWPLRASHEASSASQGKDMPGLKSARSLSPPSRRASASRVRFEDEPDGSHAKEGESPPKVEESAVPAIGSEHVAESPASLYSPEVKEKDDEKAGTQGETEPPTRLPHNDPTRKPDDEPDTTAKDCENGDAIARDHQGDEPAENYTICDPPRSRLRRLLCCC